VILSTEGVEGLPLYVEPSEADRLPFEPESLPTAAEDVATKSFPRDRLASLLVDYNRTVGAPFGAIENAQRLAEPSSLVVATGQQPYALGGPLPDGRPHLRLDHALAHLFADINFGLVVGLDDLHQFLLAVHKDAAPFVDVMGRPLD